MSDALPHRRQVIDATVFLLREISRCFWGDTLCAAFPICCCFSFRCFRISLERDALIIVLIYCLCEHFSDDFDMLSHTHIRAMPNSICRRLLMSTPAAKMMPRRTWGASPWYTLRRPHAPDATAHDSHAGRLYFSRGYLSNISHGRCFISYFLSQRHVAHLFISFISLPRALNMMPWGILCFKF